MFAWIRELSGQEKKTLIAAYGGWSVDAFDFMIYTFVIPALIAAWGMSKGFDPRPHAFPSRPLRLCGEHVRVGARESGVS